MYFEQYELYEVNNKHEIYLYLKDNHSLSEFAQEFGLTKQTKEELNEYAKEFVEKNFSSYDINAIKIMVSDVLLSTVIFSGEFKETFAIETTTVASIKFDQEVAFSETGFIPGDFYFFVQLIAEKVQFALTFEDTAKASEIIQYANETIEEVKRLFLTDTEEANHILKKAAENNSLQLTLDSNVAIDAGEALPGSGNIPEDVALEDDLEFNPEKDVDEDLYSVRDVREELQTHFSSNMTNLLFAMEHVMSGEAKQEIVSVVENTFEKMEKKLGQLIYIEDFVTGTIPVADEIGNLRDTIGADDREFERAMKEVEKLASKSALHVQNENFQKNPTMDQNHLDI